MRNFGLRQRGGEARKFASGTVLGVVALFFAILVALIVYAISPT